MNVREQIEWLGQVNAGKCYPKRLEEIDASIPYFEVNKFGDTYTIDPYNYSTHDNETRMIQVCDYLQSKIFPNIMGDITGYYNIQLHDSYTYLEDGKDYTNILTFGKYKKDKGPIVIPDCYFLDNWGGAYININDKQIWEYKLDKVIFVGSTTGSTNPLLNERIQTCLWGYNKSFCDLWITDIVQMKPDDVIRQVPTIRYVMGNYISLPDQMRYKYMLVMDGNANRWTVDTFFTNSMTLMMPSPNMLWYYPLLQDGMHYVGCDKTNMEQIVTYYNSNGEEAKQIVHNGRKLAKQLFNQEACKNYLISLFENIAANK